MKKNAILVLLILFSTASVYPQAVDFSRSFGEFNQFLNAEKLKSLVDYEEGNNYTGSPYENKEFNMGEVVSNSNEVYKNIPMRLNIYNDNIEYKDEDGKIFAIGNPAQFKQISIGESMYKNLSYISGKKTKSSWFKVVEDGDVSLLIKPIVKFKEATEAEAYKKAQPASFKRAPDDIYIKVGSDPAKIVSRKKDLLEIFPKKKNAISSYLKEHKVRLSNVEDIQELLAYLNTK